MKLTNPISEKEFLEKYPSLETGMFKIARRHSLKNGLVEDDEGWAVFPILPEINEKRTKAYYNQNMTDFLKQEMEEIIEKVNEDPIPK